MKRKQSPKLNLPDDSTKITPGRRLKKIQCRICSTELWTSVIPFLWPCLHNQNQCQKKHLPPAMAELLLTSEFDPSQDTTEPEDGFSPVYGQEEETSDFNVSVCNEVDMSPDTE